MVHAAAVQTTPYIYKKTVMIKNVTWEPKNFADRYCLSNSVHCQAVSFISFKSFYFYRKLLDFRTWVNGLIISDSLSSIWYTVG